MWSTRRTTAQQTLTLQGQGGRVRNPSEGRHPRGTSCRRLLQRYGLPPAQVLQNAVANLLKIHTVRIVQIKVCKERVSFPCLFSGVAETCRFDDRAQICLKQRRHKKFSASAIILEIPITHNSPSAGSHRGVIQTTESLY